MRRKIDWAEVVLVIIVAGLTAFIGIVGLALILKNGIQ